MKRIASAAMRAAICCALVVVAACAGNGHQRGRNESSVLPALLPSPSLELVRGGLAEIALTDRQWPSFEAAKANRIDSVARGAPLFAHIRATRPLGELALPADAGGRYSFSPYPHLYLHVGDTESVRSLNTCYLSLAPEELDLRELVVPLTPPAERAGGVPTDCWIAATASARSASRLHEIRLAGFSGQYDGWLPQAHLLAVATVSTSNIAVPHSAVRTRVVPMSEALPATAKAPAPEVIAPASELAARPLASEAASSWLRPAATLSKPLQGNGSKVPHEDARSTGAARIVIHHKVGDAATEAKARAVQRRLAARASFAVVVQSTNATVETDNLRIFFEADRPAAQAVHELLAIGPVPIRDFSDKRPLPSPGTMELWLAPPSTLAEPPIGSGPPEAVRPVDAARSSPATALRARTGAPAQPSPVSRFSNEQLRLLLLQRRPAGSEGP